MLATISTYALSLSLIVVLLKSKILDPTITVNNKHIFYAFVYVCFYLHTTFTCFMLLYMYVSVYLCTWTEPDLKKNVKDVKIPPVLNLWHTVTPDRHCEVHNFHL